ncbi:MAG TPA: CocE/NonD family hydrolase, partial [Trebonia sp.]
WGLFDPIQTQDAIKVLDWAAKLPDSNGKVGTYGPSYLGIDQLLLAGAVGRNSPLKAIFPDVAANDIYRDTSFMGGLIDSEFDLTYLGLTAGLNTVNPLGDAAGDPPVLADLASIATSHVEGLGSYDAASLANMLAGGDEDYDGTYWQQRAPQNMLASIVANGIPAYLVGGEFDLFQNGEPLNYAELQNAWSGRSVTAPMAPGQKATGRYQLIDGPWEHINGSSVDLNPLELEWFDTWLKGENTGMASTPTPLHYYDLGTGNFDETAAYPFTGAAPSKLYFGADNTLSASAPGASSAAKAGSDTIAWSPAGVPCGRPFDQWAMGALSIPAGTLGLPAPCADDDTLTHIGPWQTTYTTAPFDQAKTLSGPITATVYAKANTAETEWVAQVEEVTPSGQSYPLTEGALLGSLRAVDSSRSWTADGDTIYPFHPYTQESAQPVTPGAVTEYQIQVFPTLATLPKGDRLRVTISTTDTPHLVPVPAEMLQLTGGIYQIQRSPSAPSSLTVELRSR